MKNKTADKEVSFDVNKEEMDVILKIAKRATFAADKIGLVYKLQDAAMDITACHANGSPLQLNNLLNADDFNFSHDVFGIRRHLDRQTGKLGGFFSPRFSVKDGR